MRISQVNLRFTSFFAIEMNFFNKVIRFKASALKIKKNHRVQLQYKFNELNASESNLHILIHSAK